MNTAAKLSTGGKLSTAPFSASTKSGMKRENPPCTPYKRKARGKENNPSAISNNPSAISTGLSAGAYAGACERIRAREARRSADATPHGRKSSRSAKRRRSRRSSARHPTFCRSSGSSSKTAQTGRNQPKFGSRGRIFLTQRRREAESAENARNLANTMNYASNLLEAKHHLKGETTNCSDHCDKTTNLQFSQHSLPLCASA